MYLFIYINVCVHIYIHVYLIYLCMYIYIYLIYIHTRTRTRTHTYSLSLSLSRSHTPHTHTPHTQHHSPITRPQHTASASFVFFRGELNAMIASFLFFFFLTRYSRSSSPPPLFITYPHSFIPYTYHRSSTSRRTSFLFDHTPEGRSSISYEGGPLH